MFGYRSLQPTGVAHELLEAANALQVQSREHPDGWGLGWYSRGAPQVVRALEAAHRDDDFAAVGRFVTSTTILAHVRKASVGRVAVENTHPFEWGPWLFVHNGTIPRWGECRGKLEARIDPELRKLLTGETDSERCFHLFLTALRRRCDPLRATFAAAAEALAETVAIVCEAAEDGSSEKASTTFLATDGELMVACRRGRTLFVETPPPSADGRVSAIVIASEQPCRCEGRVFREVPEGSLVGVDGSLKLSLRPLAT